VRALRHLREFAQSTIIVRTQAQVFPFTDITKKTLKTYNTIR